MTVGNLQIAIGYTRYARRRNTHRVRASEAIWHSIRLSILPSLSLLCSTLVGDELLPIHFLLLRALLISLLPQSSVFRRFLKWRFRLVDLTDFPHGCQISLVLLLLKGGFSLLGQFAHDVQHSQMPLCSLAVHSNGLGRSLASWDLHVCTSPPLGFLDLCSDMSTCSFNSARVSLEVRRLRHISRKTFEANPSFKALPGCPTISSGRVQTSWCEAARYERPVVGIVLDQLPKLIVLSKRPLRRRSCLEEGLTWHWVL